ncbi:MAG: heparinase II/III family protein, partial [Balneolales bacterium]
NAFALTIGGYSLNQEKIFEKGLGLLIEQLDEQICKDGAHYEKSPMYQQILLDRLLDTLNFLSDYEHSWLSDKASKMLSWLSNITFFDGSIPYVNDSTPGIAPSTLQLSKYAGSLGVVAEKTKLGNSFYRKFSNGSYEMVADCGGVGPDYQPGHSHNDAGSFVLHVKNKPFIVDTGTSTYKNNVRRAYERSVKAHNTTHPINYEPSELWGSFRIARREFVEIVKESADSIEFKRILPYGRQYSFTRTFRVDKDTISICDRTKTKDECKAYLHFSSQIDLTKTDYGISSSEVDIYLSNASHFNVEACEIVNGFNQLQTSKKVVITFFEQLNISIKINHV